jgi:CubicO group peptidase (beta-lactamase class C family)
VAIGVAPLAPAPLRAQVGGPAVDLAAVTEALGTEIRRAMIDGQLPSVAVALVAGGEVAWTGAFGEANVRTGVPATASTVYHIASTFKPMAAAALLQLVEDGLLDLDDPVRERLRGLSIRGEDRRNPITYRHFLTHTSGLPSTFSPVPVWGDSLPSPVPDYLEDNLVVQGPPSERVRYSNLGFTLLAYLVEQASGKAFDEYVRNNVFLPAGMTSTDFRLTPDMEERLAIPYVPDPDTGRLGPVAQVRFAEWPAGGVWGTVEDLGRWLAVNLNGGTLEGRQLLLPETVTLSHTLQYPELRVEMAGGWGEGNGGYGLAWWTTERAGERYIAHAGSVQGYTSFVHANVDRGFGIALLTNGHRAHEHLVRLGFLATDLMALHRR